MNAVPHKTSSPALFRAVLLMFLVSFVSAQFAAAEHRASHAFHKHTHLCDSFLSFEHNGANPLTGVAPLLVLFIAITLSFSLPVVSVTSRTRDFARIRGPPLLLA